MYPIYTKEDIVVKVVKKNGNEEIFQSWKIYNSLCRVIFDYFHRESCVMFSHLEGTAQVLTKEVAALFRPSLDEKESWCPQNERKQREADKEAKFVEFLARPIKVVSSSDIREKICSVLNERKLEEIRKFYMLEPYVYNRKYLDVFCEIRGVKKNRIYKSYEDAPEENIAPPKKIDYDRLFRGKDFYKYKKIGDGVYSYNPNAKKPEDTPPEPKGEEYYINRLLRNGYTMEEIKELEYV